MVGHATSFTGSGLRDWLVQRVSACYLAAYLFVLLGYLISLPEVSYVTWTELFNYQVTRYATLFAFIAIMVHAWIGMWTIATDYIKPNWIRLLFYVFVWGVLLTSLIWSIRVLGFLS